MVATLNIFGWQVSLIWFILICVGAVIVILLTLSLCCVLCYCCFCREPDDRERRKETPSQTPPVTGLPVAAGAGLGAGVGVVAVAANQVSPYKPPPQHVVIPVDDSSVPLTHAPSNPSSKNASDSPAAGVSPGPGGYSPAAVRKWEEQLQQTLFRKMSLEEIRSSTGYFNKRFYLGEGAFAVVYRGAGPNGVPWAVKRSKQLLVEGSAGAQDFEKEVIAISRLSHKHIVRLLGYCQEEGEHILVYEYCPNGSLSAALYTGKPDLSFLQRLDVAIGTAEALYYLHSASSPPIIHRDVKPDNIFLDSRLQAKVGDFGLLKKLLEDSHPTGLDSEEQSQEAIQRMMHSVYTRIAGTPGYLDPEYHLTSKVTDKGDVYSFGVLLLQMCTGQRAILAQHPKFSQAGSSLQAGSIPPGGPSLGPSKSAPEGVGAEAAEGGVAGGSGSRFTQKSTPSSVGPGQEQSPSTASGSVSMSPANRAAGMGSSTAFAGLGDGGMGPGEVRDGEPMPGEPIHISTWLEPYVRAKVVEPVADARFGNNYNKTALFRMLEIGLLCVQASARKRPGMSTVSRWLHEVREELAREVEEPEGQYSSVFAFDHHSTSRGSWGAGALDSLVETESWRSLTRGPSARSTWGAAGPRYSHPSPGAGPDTSMAYDQSTMQHAARMSQGR